MATRWVIAVGCIGLAAGAAAADPVTPARRSIPARVVATYRVPPPALAMMLPTDVIVDRDNQVLVADGVNDRIVAFDPDGKVAHTWSRFGQVKLGNPIGLAVDRQNRLWITDNGHRRVLLVAPGRRVASVISLAADVDPTGIVVSADGSTTYIVDNDGHRVLVRDNATGQLREIGSNGAALGQLRWPFLAALDGDGALYVTEAIGARIQRLDATLRWTNSIGQWGIAEAQFYRPKGIAIDPHNRVFVSDSTLRVVQCFTGQGRFLGVVSDAAGVPLRFGHPMGLAFDHLGRLLVVEADLNQVGVVELLPDTGAD